MSDSKPTTDAAAAEETPAAPAEAEKEAPTEEVKEAAQEEPKDEKTEEEKVEGDAKEGEEEKKDEEKKEEEKKVEEPPAPVYTDRVMIVTGASGGIGLEVARILCEGGNEVILACKNEEKANRAVERIKAKTPHARATYMNLDLSSVESIKAFVAAFHESGKKLHVLVNNAAVMLSPKDTRRQLTKEGLELTIGTNHFGTFLLTSLLLDDLKASAAEEGSPESRIINTSCYSHDPEAMKRKNKQQRDLQPLDLDNVLLFGEGTYSGLQAYKNSKAAVLMCTYEQARRLEGSNVTVNACCPGFVPSTELLRSSSGMQKFLSRYIMHGMLRFAKLTRTVAQGAHQVCSLATDEAHKGVSGKYFKDGAEVTSSEETRDEEKQKKLWEITGGMLQLEGFTAIEIPPAPKEEEPAPKKKEEKKEKKEAANGEAKPVVDGKEENKDTEEKKDEEKKDEETKTEEIKSDKEAIKEEEKAAAEEIKASEPPSVPPAAEEKTE